MRFELNITAGQVITTLLIGLVCFGIGMMAGNNVNQVSEVGLSDGDWNTLIELSHFTGHCERLGLESNVLIDDVNGVPVGYPVCVNPKQNN